MSVVRQGRPVQYYSGVIGDAEHQAKDQDLSYAVPGQKSRHSLGRVCCRGPAKTTDLILADCADEDSSYKHESHQVDGSLVIYTMTISTVPEV